GYEAREFAKQEVKPGELAVISKEALEPPGNCGGGTLIFQSTLIGPAPNWCFYLQILTEELNEGAETTIDDNYKFLTKEDLERLRLTKLIGTNLLRAYMHGFFVRYSLYKKKGGLSLGDVAAQYKYKKAAVSTKLTITDVLPSTKAIASVKFPDYKSSKLEAQDLHEHASFTTAVGLNKSPAVDFSATI
ncbi:hypothetical protein ABKV19_026343, partial [Rosa sericea]